MALHQFLKRIAQDKSGATAVEYGLIAALIAVAIITGLSAVADGEKGVWAVASDKATAVLG